MVWVDRVGGSLRIPPGQLYLRLSPSSLPVGHIDTRLPWLASRTRTTAHLAREIASLA